MKVATATLIGPGLDYAVASCEGTLPASFDDWKQTWPHYSTRWAAGGPLVDRERMNFATIGTGPRGVNGHPPVVAIPAEGRRAMEGLTHLIAAMRALVANRIGDEVEIPEELLR